MGTSTSRTVRPPTPPPTLYEFKNLSDPADQHVIPELPQKRKLTDKHSLIAFGVVLIFLVPFLIYTLVFADINRLIHGYDPCGNVCGEKNTVVQGLSCSGQDMESKPYLMFDELTRQVTEEVLAPRHCVENCSNEYVQILNRCFKKDSTKNNDDLSFKSFTAYMQQVAASLRKASGQIVGMILIAIGTTIAIVLLFRYATKYIVWGILIGSLLGFAALSALFWIWNSQTSKYENKPFLFFAIFFTVATVLLAIIMLVMVKRIKLIIMLFKEAMRAVFDMPLILVEPLLTSLALIIAFIIFVYVTLMMTTSGFLKVVRGSTYVGGGEEIDNNFYAYAPNAVMIFTFILNTVIFLWVTQFIIGCQHMVLSGAVSAWYFCRDKASLVSPIYNSFYTLIKYHLGTVACGSLIITIVGIIRAIIRGLVNERYRPIVDCCLAPIEQFLKYLTKNAYIQTAMHGQAFYKSGKRGAKLLLANVVNVVALNSVGGFVLSAAMLLIMVITIIAGCLMYDETNEHFYAAIILCAFIAAIIGSCALTVFETAIDTLFMCYCEDSIINDGTTSPYFMSTNLMQFVEESKKVVPKK